MRKLCFLTMLVALTYASPPACRAEAPPAHGLEFHEFVTGGASADDKLPLIIAVHGLGDSPKKFAGLLSGFKEPARVVCPRGPVPHGKGYSWFDTRISKGRVTSIDLAEIEEASDRLALLIATLSKSRPTKGKAVITGFSQGGVLSFVVAFRHPDSVGAAIPVGGMVIPMTMSLLVQVLPFSRALWLFPGTALLALVLAFGMRKTLRVAGNASR